MLDVADVRRRFDRELREDPPPVHGASYEHDQGLVREVGDSTTVLFHRVTESEAPERIRAEIHRAEQRAHVLEWKVYEHDAPASLPALLAAAGLVPDLPETLLVRDLQAHPGVRSPATGFEVRAVDDETSGDDAYRTRRRAFGPEDDTTREQFGRLLDDPRVRTFLAYRDGVPVATGRVDLPSGRSFAGLWGGGTVPEQRHRGAYRALVEARAECAAAAGFRYVFVEARETSRPTLERLGFERVSAVRGWRWEAAPG